MDADTLSGLKYPKLQSLAKKNDVKANQTKDELVDQLARKLSRQSLRSSSRRSLKRQASEMEPEGSEDESPQVQRAPPLIASHTRPSRSGTAPPSINTRSQSTPRTSSRVVSVAAPRASLFRRSSKPPAPIASTIAIRKARESQKRLGVGRPTAVGGSGARKSTSRPLPPPQQQPKTQGFFQKPNHIVEVVMPSMRMLRDEPDAASVASSSKGISQLEPVRSGQNNGIDARLARLETDMTKEKQDSIFFHAQIKDLWKLQTTVQRLSTLVNELREECADLRLENETLRTARGEPESPQMDEGQVAQTTVGDNQGNQATEGSDAQGDEDQVAEGGLDPTTSSVPPALERESSTEPTDRTGELPNGRLSVPAAIPPSSRPVRASSRTRSPARRGTPSTIVQVATTPRSRTKSSQIHASPFAASRPSANESGRALSSHPSPSHNERSIKRRRLDDEGDHAAAPSSESVDGAVLVRQHTLKPKSNGKATGPILPVATATSPIGTSEPSNRAPFPVRALSQPPWSKKSSHRTGTQDAAGSSSRTTRRTRAGSAGPSDGVQLGSSRPTTLATVGEQAAEEPPAVAGPSEPVPPPPARLNLLALPRIQGSPSRAPFLSYPLTADPVKPLQPLTQSDSGSELFAGVSKQGYRTDWHDGVVFDDPIDAESVRRAATLAVHAELGEAEQSPLFSDDEGPDDSVPHFMSRSLGEDGTFEGMVDLGMGAESPF